MNEETYLQIKEEVFELKRRINILEKKLNTDDQIPVTCLEKYHAYFDCSKINKKKAFETLMEILINHPIDTLHGVHFTVYEIPVNGKTGHGAIRVAWQGNNSVWSARRSWKAPVNKILGMKTT